MSMALLVIGILSNLSLSATALSSPVETPRKQAVVVGGGPVGLATALTLSNEPHCYDVTILEQAEMEQYDPTKAYLYNVNARGQVWMKENFPGALEKLRVRGSQGSMSRITIVPADPEVPIPPRKTLGTYDTTKKTNKSSDADAKKEATEKESKISYWVPRHSMICLLEDEIHEQQSARKNSKQTTTVGAIELKKNRIFSNMVPNDVDGSLEVSVENLSSGTTEAYCGNLIVAADGFNSAVRACLADNTKITWLQKKAKKFNVKRWASPASGLRMKVIQLPPGFSIQDSDGSMLATENEYTYAIRGANTGFTNWLSLGLLPVKDPAGIRPANVITRPNHDIWNIDNGPEAKTWFTKAFPRFSWDDYVNDAEWDRFAKAKGTTFPNCQYSPGLQISSPNGQSGVALVGDAAHAFPPDIGQGINAGLCDVVAFDRALRGNNILTGEKGEKPESISAALQKYEKVQVPQNRALIRISRFGFPYQYRQALLKDRIGRLFLTFNIAFRVLLNKLSFGLIPASCIVTLQNPDLSYRKVMRRADLTTAGLSAAALTLIWKIFGTGLKKAVGLP